MKIIVSIIKSLQRLVTGQGRMVSIGWNDQGRVVRKPVNANPGLKVNRGINFSCIKVLSIVYVLCSLRLVMLKTEGQKL